MTVAQALFMGLLQGATELFPVSSLGHAVLIPSLLRWSFKQSDPSFVPFLVLLHLGTAGALLFIYRRQWVEIVKGFFTAAIRGRIEIRRLVRGLTAQGRLAGFVLSALPAGLLLIISLVNPSYAHPLFHTTPGLIALGVAVGLMGAGSYIIRRIINITV